MDVEGGQGATSIDSNTQTQEDGNKDANNQSKGQEQETVTDAHTVEDDRNGGRKKRKLTSSVWNDFKKIKVNGEDKAECQHCFKKLGGKSKNGTHHLHDHLAICDLVEMIIVHEYPLVIVEHHGFRKFVSGLQPFFKVPCRNTIKSAIKNIYDFEKEKTMRILEKNTSRVAITTDMWTSSNQKKGFMAITAHLIDNNWNMQSRIMRFIYIPCPHTAEVLAEVIYDSLCDWNIDRKLSTVTVYKL